MKGENAMLFNLKIVLEVQRNGSIKKSELASLLGVSYNHIYKIEKGLRNPSLKLVKKVSALTGVPVADLLSEDSKFCGGSEPEICGDARTITDFKNKLNRKRDELLTAEERIVELERKLEHLTAIISIHRRFEDILFYSGPLSNAERSEKLNGLAKAAFQENEATFNEIRSIFRMKRATLRNLLCPDKQAYPCKFAEGGEVFAYNPGDAALRLRCFGCGAFESHECHGHGNERRPANIIELLTRLEANGVIHNSELAEIVTECYKTPISAHGISEVKYRYERGLAIPEGIFYLDGQNKKK
jgi:transcriptional regulator with XRE-family HTH domain